ncbi:MAG: sulfotransferase family protein [Arenicellales bacterium]|jgi:hypothetical protein
MRTKVFCIGFHKTGTTSLAVALEQFGYRVTGPFGVSDPNIEKNAVPMACALARNFDAFQDNPWPIIYKELDKEFPGSKFILMLRDPESWIKSQVEHFGRKETAMRKWIYGAGCPEGNEDIYVKRFEEHNNAALRYFRDRPQDLLVMDLAKGDGWRKLCPFLGIDIPDIAFPHANKARSRRHKSASNVLLSGRIKSLVIRMTTRFVSFPVK